jgi:hypothetical protein
VVLLGSGGLRLLYGFLLVFLAFAIRTDALGGGLLVVNGEGPQLAFVGGAFGVGTLIATGIGSALRVSRPVPLLATGVVLVTLAGLWATARFSFLSVLALCLCTALASGLAKVAVDAAIHERVPERERANAFARTETLLMLTWLAGGAIGLVPNLPVRLGIAIATVVALVAMAAAIATAAHLRGDVLRSGPTPDAGPAVQGELLHRGAGPAALPAAPVSVGPASPAGGATPPADPAGGEAPPGYHIFRPSPAEPPGSGG